jgi:hypothetical protein
MNLQENINRIHQMMGINESNFFKRRLNSEETNEEFNYSLDYATNMFNHILDINDVSEEDFKRIVMNVLMDGFHPKLSNGGQDNFPYDDVYSFLLNHYESKIENRYNRILNDKSIRS